VLLARKCIDRVNALQRTPKNSKDDMLSNEENPSYPICSQSRCIASCHTARMGGMAVSVWKDLSPYGYATEQDRDSKFISDFLLRALVSSWLTFFLDKYMNIC